MLSFPDFSSLLPKTLLKKPFFLGGLFESTWKTVRDKCYESHLRTSCCALGAGDFLRYTLSMTCSCFSCTIGFILE